MATDFQDFEDERHPNTPFSVHGHFWIAHDKVLKLKECIEQNCQDRNKLVARAKSSLDRLDIASDEFIEQANKIIIQVSSVKK